MPVLCSVCKELATRVCTGCHGRTYCGEFIRSHQVHGELQLTRLVSEVKCLKADLRTHEKDCKRQNYILKIDLHPRFITDPPISRTLACPANATFAALDFAIIVAFDWANIHSSSFDVFDPKDAQARQGRVSGLRPLFNIKEFHFDSDNVRLPQRSRDFAKVTLCRVFEDPKLKDTTIRFTYDFGDGWEHFITCVGRTDLTTKFNCLEGNGHACAEGVGGWRGWRKLLEAYDAESPTEDQKERIKWYETEAVNKDRKGLRGDRKLEWDRDQINSRLNRFHIISVPKTESFTPSFVVDEMINCCDQQST